MTGVLKKIFVSVCACVAAVCASAQISVDAPTVVGLNEQFNITFTLSEKPSSFDWNPGDNFQLVWGPQTGSSTSISIINGKHSKQSKYTYTYVLLPRQNGSFTLAAAHAVVDGKEVYSKQAQISVVSNGASGAQQGNSQDPSSADGQGGQAAGGERRQNSSAAEGDIFMRLTLSRTSAVVGEPITATLKLYTRSNVAGFEDAKFPSFNGFWAQELESPQNIAFQRESVGDRIYNSALLRKWVIIPQKTGAVTIDPAELVCLLQQRISSGNSIFDGFFDDYQTIRKRISTKAVTINVSSLPAGAPDSFTGAVGNFTLKAKLSNDSLKVHDAASLMVTVSGKGNVALVGAPKINFPPDSEIYDTKTSDRIDSGSGGTSGVKTFEYPFIPRSHGDFEIPSVEFTYYDIAQRRYVTLSSGPIPYHVEKGAGVDYVPQEGISVSVNKKDVKSLSDDIHYISTRMPRMKAENSFFVGTPLFWLFTVLCLVAALAVYLIVSWLRRRRNDVVSVRTRGASKAARRRLSLADSYLKKNLYSAYYEELHKALLGYAADKLNISFADLSKESISEAMLSCGARQADVDDFVALVDSCEFARYSPSSSNEAMKESYDKALSVISSLESSMKKSSAGAKAAGMIIPLVMMLGMGQQAQAQNESYVDSLWNAGVRAYAEDNYLQSAKYFTSIADLGLSSPELYTNIADAYYKNQEYGQAILYYERALKLDPSFKDAKYNLEIARGHILDRIESVPEFFLKSWSRKLSYLLSSNSWTAIYAVMLVLALGMLLLFLLGRTSLVRKLAFFSSLLFLLLSGLALGNAFAQKKAFQAKDEAVVTKAVCAAKSSPSAVSGADLFVLHEGTKVRILDNVGQWVKISISDGREAWVEAGEITVI